MQTFLLDEFWTNFLANGAATLLGVLLGIPSALWLDKNLRFGEAKKKKRDILILLQQTLKKNEQLLAQVEKELGKPKYIVFYDLDLTILEATSSIKYELIDDSDFNRAVDDVRFELQHLKRKIDLQLSMGFSPEIVGNKRYAEIRDVIVSAIVGHCPEVIKKIASVQQQISSKLD